MEALVEDDLEWVITVHAEQGYAEVVTSGVADKDGTMRMVRAIAEALQPQAVTKVLIDHRQVECVTGTTLDVYHRPSVFPPLGVASQVSIAEVIRPEHWDHFRFFETVCRNRGFHISVFLNKEEALSWLLE